MLRARSSSALAAEARAPSRVPGVVAVIGAAPRAAAANKRQRRCALTTVAVAAGGGSSSNSTTTKAPTTTPSPSPLTSLAQILSGAASPTLTAAQQLIPLLPRSSDTPAATEKPKKLPPFRAPPTTDTHPLPLRLGWAGSGLFFWWQLGAVAYLRDRYDLCKVKQVGASGGALAAVLAACDVCPDRTMDVALELSERYGVWTRPLGLMGVWGRIVEEWLDELLPEDAHERCSGNVGVVYTVLPTCEQVVADAFTSKRDLMDCLLASAHVPFFLDFRLARPVRGQLAVDGSFPDFFTEMNSPPVTAGGEALVFDYYSDSRLARGSRLDMLALKEPDAIRHVMRLGYEYAHRLHDPVGAPLEPDGAVLAETHGLGGGAAFVRFDWSAVALPSEVAAGRAPGLPPRNVAVLGVEHGAPPPWAAAVEEGEAVEAAGAASTEAAR
jgi:hypothetical protein